jgi:hypothetical protein
LQAGHLFLAQGGRVGGRMSIVSFLSMLLARRSVAREHPYDRIYHAPPDPYGLLLLMSDNIVFEGAKRMDMIDRRP